MAVRSRALRPSDTIAHSKKVRLGYNHWQPGPCYSGERKGEVHINI